MSTPARFLVDGVQNGTISPADRGLNYGDGLFETLAVALGEPRRWPAHLARLSRGCQRLGFPAPDPTCLEAEVAALCGGVSRGVLKVVITRGTGGRGYRPPAPARPTRVLSLHPWPDYPERWQAAGVRLRICRHRVGLNPALAGLKHLNRLDQVLARAEWDDPAIDEGLMLDPLDRVVEGTMSNLFLVHDGTLATPSLGEAGVAGIVRAEVLAAAAGLGLPHRIAHLDLDAVRRAEELFVCNSIAGICPVRSLEATAYPVPGPLTRRLQQALARGSTTS